MRELAVYDYKNYIENGTVGRRPSVRGVIIRDGKIALVHSLRYDYYKFPGGGIDEGETHLDTLIREVREESGLVVIPATAKEYGMVIRKEKGKREDLFIQENFYYLCEAEPEVASQNMDEDEAYEQFTLEWIEPEKAIDVNLHHPHGEKNQELAIHMMEREANVLRMLIQEGFFECR